MCVILVLKQEKNGRYSNRVWYIIWNNGGRLSQGFRIYPYINLDL